LTSGPLSSETYQPVVSWQSGNPVPCCVGIGPWSHPSRRRFRLPFRFTGWPRIQPCASFTCWRRCAVIVSQRGIPQLDPSQYGPCRRLTTLQADGQQSDQLPPPGNVLVCFAPWDASLGLRIFAHDPGNRLMPTLTAGARSIRTLFPGSRLIASGPTCEVRGGAESLRATFDIDIAGTVRSLVHSS